jgi:predicted metalloendopeptidase
VNLKSHLSLLLLAGAATFAADPPPPSGIDSKAMDTSANPCQNFFAYACGNWRKANPIPADRGRWSRFEELAERNLAIERDILEKAAGGGEARTANEQKIGDYYASCMDEAAIEAAGTRPVAEALARIDKMSSKQDLVAELVRLHQTGVRALFGFGVGPDAKNSTMQVAHVDQGGLGLPDRDYYLKDDPRSTAVRKKYEETIAKLFALANDGKTRDAAAVMRMETALAKASMDRVARRNPDNTYHKMTVAELGKLTPGFDWPRYFDGIGAPKIESLVVNSPDFLKAMDALAASTELSDLKTYLAWHVLNQDASLLPKAFRDAHFELFGKMLLGQKEQPARWKQCVQSTDRALGEALGQKFVEAAFQGASKDRALQLVGEIEKAMARDVTTADWMTPATKDQALTKLHQVTNKIGYPEKWKDYSTVKIVRGNYYADAKQARQFEIRRNLAKLGKPVDKSEWMMTPPTVNAYYSPLENNINFPAGILQPPFYNAKADDAVNYGAIGVVIGHELTHGFDDQGRRYDGAGNLRDWWTAEDAKAFESRADCVAKEYGGFSPVPGVNLNGKLTLGENAADNGGIRLAYMALVDSLGKTVVPKMDGFTAQQRFFIGYAQIWCENATEEFSRSNALTNPHSPGQFRVNGVVQNQPEFKEAFACQTGDPMVSGNACRVW